MANTVSHAPVTRSLVRSGASGVCLDVARTYIAFTCTLQVLIVGAGPCGLRLAVECALLGARTVVVEAREYFSRNNVLHLWPFVIQDVKLLGGKSIYPKFCTGAINHVSKFCTSAISHVGTLCTGAMKHVNTLCTGALNITSKFCFRQVTM